MSSLLARTVIAYLIVFAVPMILPVAFIKLVGLGGLRELVTYEARDTPLHKLDPRLKVLYPIAMGVLSIILTWRLHAHRVRAQPSLPWFWLRPSRQKIRVLMVMVIGPALTGFWSQGLYYLPNPPIHFLYQFPWTISWLGSPGITSLRHGVRPGADGPRAGHRVDVHARSWSAPTSATSPGPSSGSGCRRRSASRSPPRCGSCPT